MVVQKNKNNLKCLFLVFAFAVSNSAFSFIYVPTSFRKVMFFLKHEDIEKIEVKKEGGNEVFIIKSKKKNATNCKIHKLLTLREFKYDTPLYDNIYFRDNCAFLNNFIYQSGSESTWRFSFDDRLSKNKFVGLTPDGDKYYFDLFFNKPKYDMDDDEYALINDGTSNEMKNPEYDSRTMKQHWEAYLKAYKNAKFKSKVQDAIKKFISSKYVGRVNLSYKIGAGTKSLPYLKGSFRPLSSFFKGEVWSHILEKIKKSSKFAIFYKHGPIDYEDFIHYNEKSFDRYGVVFKISTLHVGERFSSISIEHQHNGIVSIRLINAESNEFTDEVIKHHKLYKESLESKVKI
jgi:hypothetical protein